MAANRQSLLREKIKNGLLKLDKVTMALILKLTTENRGKAVLSRMLLTIPSAKLFSLAQMRWLLVSRPIFKTATRFRRLTISASMIAFASCPLVAQTSVSHDHTAIYYTVDEMFNREAEASNSVEINRYSKDLVKAVVPGRAGDVYIDALSDRLATSEQMARQGKGSLIPEADIVRAYNQLMKRIGAPSSFYAEKTEMKKFRAHSIDTHVLPSLITANRNGTLCNPGEAVYLFLLLLSGSGKLPADQADVIKSQQREDGSGEFVASVPHSMYNEAQGRLTIYSLQHNPQATVRLFNGVASTFRF